MPGTGRRRTTPRPEPLPALTDDDRRRYARHLVLPEVGEPGQRRLKRAKVLIVGAGGLGAPVALYLAAAGIGHLGLAEFDTVDESNLQRQVIYGVSDLGRPKLEAAARRLSDLNPEVEVVPHPGALSAANVLSTVRPYDLVVDGTDNFPARYLVNDACVASGIPDVFGSVYRFEGQVSVFGAPRGPCYRCLFPEPPPPDASPSCAEGGVLGALPGLVGLLQTTEALKLVIGKGEPLVGRLLLYDALEMRFRELTIRRDPHCPRCSPKHRRDPIVAIDGDACATPIEVSAAQLADELSGARPPLLVDVRTDEEFAEGHLAGARLVPIDELAERAGEIDPDRPVVLYCQMGGRSGRGTRMLRDLGRTNVRTLKGGLLGWKGKVVKGRRP